MCRPADVPCRTSLITDHAGLVRQCVVRTSLTRPVVAFRRAVLALTLPTALLSSAALPQTPPVTVEATPVTASVGRAITTSTSLALGAPRVTAPTVGTVTTSALNLRMGPGTGYAVITTLSYGTQGTVLGQANGWYNVQTTRGTGWVIGTYFSVGATAPTAPTPAPVAGTGYVTISALNLRTGPGTGYGVIAVLGYGTQGTLVGQANGWYNIQTTIGTGWVSGTYFSVGGAPAPAAPAPAPVSGVVGARATMVPNGQFISGWGAPRSSGPHQGEDLAAAYGSPIYAPARLTILSNYWDSLGGWSVFGRDALGRDWYFGHMSSRSPVGSTVVKGQVIGYVGTTGSAEGTTPHLHYQVSYPGGAWGNPVYVLQSYPDVP